MLCDLEGCFGPTLRDSLISGWSVQDVVYSFPVECKDGKWSIVQGLPIDDFAAAKLKATGDELVEEKALALECLAES